MQGRSDPQRELLDVEAIAGHLLPAGGVFAFLAVSRSRLVSHHRLAAGRSSGAGERAPGATGLP